MSIHVMNMVWRSAPCSGNSLLALLALADWSNDEGKSWPSICTLAKKSRQSERNCRTVVRYLESKKLISIEEREGNSSVFTINLDYFSSEGGQILPPAKKSTRGGIRRKSLPTPPANIAPNTSIHTSLEEDTSVSPHSEEGFLFNTERDEITRERKVVKEKTCDPRCKAVTAKIFEAYKFHNKVNPPWGAAEGKQLKNFLASHSDWSEEKIFECIRNRSKSEVNLAQEPLGWISKLGNYAGGPLDKFGNPKSNGNGYHNGQQSRTNGSVTTGHLLDHLPDADEIQRRRIADDKRLEERRNARGM